MSPEEIAALQAQIDRRFDLNDEDHAEIKNLIKVQNTRIKELEIWQSFVKGVSAGVSGTIHVQSLIMGIIGGGGVIGIALLIRGL